VNSKRLTIVSFVCAMLGLLLIFEVIRPFHDMSKDGPLAMILWGVGATVAAFLCGHAQLLSVSQPYLRI
jgi:hypothetical protein